ncbi:hypothetical protein J2755_002288 [Methanohalophilus levihalophilus]|uniref:DUF473 domain-containing protein n=1 Tax=Methanohalophilus levihalophilus TaxID=1431282 RepID=UPI001AE99945|nr:DUF473 domain-containing protein [Methanohalophilus levihalophilus]MBP2031325.1 hypothetical protein [Methanohalophilus levihalophilus]
MEYKTLTSISYSAMQDLKDHMLRTIEIRSPQNFLASLDLEVGEEIFLTSTSTQDLTPGTMGIIGSVTQHQVATHRIVNSNDSYYEERETTMIRIQIRPRCVGRVRKVLSNQIGHVTVTEAEAVSFYDAR